MKQERPDILVVGAGIFGLTIAERVATELNKKVLLVEKRDHIGGNAYSEFDRETGIEIHKYGAHLFHTSRKKVWDYVKKFTDFTDYQHRVYTVHNGEVFPLPINLGTINQFFRLAYSPEEAKQLVAKQSAEAPRSPKNLRDKGISLIGRPLFEAFIMNYTAKQWQTPAEDLPPEIITRLPVRYNYDNRYFSDTYEGLPAKGYIGLFERMVNACGDNIEVRLGIDYLENEELKKLTESGVITVFTGPIDRFYDYRYGKLSWRSVEFKQETLETVDFQGCPVMNYADLDAPYTRIIEFKHFNPERALKKSGKTIIAKEYSKQWRDGDEPYYPVRKASDLAMLKKYQQLADKETHVFFGGRLGEYAYYDMDATFDSALNTYEKTLKPLLARD